MGGREGEGEIERREWIDRERGRRGRALAAEGKRGGEDREEGVGLAGLGFGRWGAGWAADGPERPVGSAQVERKWPEAWLGLPLSSLSLIFTLAEKQKERRKEKEG